MAPATPVAMIENASLPQQRSAGAMCGDGRGCAGFGLRSPAILVIGEVVGEQQALGLIAAAG